MKVLITTDCYIPTINGVVTSIINLKKGLENLGHEVRVLSLSSTNKTEIINNNYYIGAIKSDFVYPDAKIRIMPAKAVFTQIKNWQPDIIHSQSEFSIFPLAKKLSKQLNIPMVHTYHTVYKDYTHYFSPSKTLGRKVVAKMSRQISKACSMIIAPTQKVETMLKGYEIDCNTQVIPSGINLSKFNVNQNGSKLDELKNLHNIPNDAIVFVSVSRVCKEKNIDELICFLKNSSQNNAILLIVGDGPHRLELENLVKSLQLQNKVIFAGMVNPSDIPLYYKLADYFLSASTSETQGLTYIEALASGTPILCRKDDCLSNVLIDGVNGFEYSNEEEFQAVFKKLCHLAKTDYHNNLSINASESVEKFSVETFAKNIEYTYLSALNSKKLQLEKETKKQSIGKNISLLGACLLVLILIIGYYNGWFSSIETLQNAVLSFGIFAPLFFILLQISQVVVPIIPGGLGCLAGVILFGPFKGFLYNYIGICIGSILAFSISKIYGQKIMNYMFSNKTIEKYSTWIDTDRRFDKLFALAIFLPVAPDDFLCYLAGTTNMKWNYFTSVILGGKILSIAAYSLGLTVAWQQLLTLF